MAFALNRSYDAGFALLISYRKQKQGLPGLAIPVFIDFFKIAAAPILLKH
jgi:hypothetical protein